MNFADIFLLIFYLITKSMGDKQICFLGGVYSDDFGKCYQFFTVPQAYESARQVCIAIGGNLLTVHSAFEQAAIAADVANRFTVNYWIGLSDTEQTGTWKWDDGTPSTYTNWQSGNPTSAGGHCAASLIDTGKWYNTDCNVKNNFVCEVIPDDDHMYEYSYCPGSEQKWNTYGKCFYFVKSSQTFEEAKSTCNNMHGLLASITDSSQQTFVGGEISKRQFNADYWIGLRDKNENGNWQWEDTTPFSFSNWDAGYPLTNAKKDCALGWATNNKWRNDLCDATHYFVCQTTAGWFYYSDTNAWYQSFGTEIGGWNSYELRCAAEGGHLASIHSEGENYLVFTNGGDNTWIGLTCDSGNLKNFKWTDGSALDFTKWRTSTHTYCCAELEYDKSNATFYWVTNQYDCTTTGFDGVCKVPA